MTESFAGQTVEAARRALTARLKSASIDSAELDARILAGAALGLDLTGMIASAARHLTQDEAARLEDFTRRRLAGEPVARILGVKEFWGLPLQLSAETLVPRPDTETLVELALEMLRAASHPDRPLRIADLGTGSGAILLALLSELPDAHGVGTDLSPDALQTAHSNALRLGLADRAAFIACDYATGLSDSFRSDCVEPALRALGRYRRSRQRGTRSRSAPRAWTAAPTDLTPIARSFRRRNGCCYRAASSLWRSEMVKARTWSGC